MSNVRKIQGSSQVKSVAEAGSNEVVSLYLKELSFACAKIASVYERSNRKKIFYKTKAFWSMMLVIIGLMGYWINWQQQIRVMNVAVIQKQINSINNFKKSINKAIIFSRATIINQALECPINNRKKLIKMRQQRILTLIAIASNSSGLTFKTTSQIYPIEEKIVSVIYKMDLNKICQIKPNRFDKNLQNLQDKLDTIINRTLEQKYAELRSVEDKSFFPT